MRRPNRVVLAGASLALSMSLGCEPVRGLSDAGPGGGDDPDASVGAPDASTLPPGEAIVSVLDERNQPLEGVLVIFHDPRGDVAAQLITGADGTVRATVEANSFVTVIESNYDDQGIYHRLKTMHGVMPDDTIVIGPRVLEPSWEFLGDVFVIIGAAYGDAADYNVHLGCYRAWTDSVGTQIVFPFVEDECSQGVSQRDLLFTAHGADNAPLAYSVAPNVNVGDTITSPAWQTDWRSVAVNATNAPDGMVLVRPGLSLVHHDIGYEIVTPDGRPISRGQGATFDMKHPSAFASALQARLDGVFSDSGPAAANGISTVVRNIAPAAGNVSVNLTSDLLPRVTDVEIRKQSDEWHVDFKVDGDQPDVSALAAGMTWRDASGTTPVEWEWTVVADPRLGPPIRVPLLPEGAVVDPINGSQQWPPPDGAEVTTMAAGLADVQPGAWPSFHQERPFDFFDHLLPLTAPAGQQARMSIGGVFELGN